MSLATMPRHHSPIDHDATIKRLVAMIDESGGFTVDPVTLESVTSGWAVSLPEYQITPERADLVDAIRATLTNAFHTAEGFAGAWRDEETGTVYLDVSRIFASQRRALHAARKANQLAIYHLDTGQTLYVPQSRKVA